jgi:opacity protein-like surface antigen
MTKRITSLFALTTLVLAVSGSAFAADIAVKAPPLAPAPVYSWTGFYVGGNLGASFGHVKTDFNAAPVTVTTSGGTFTTPGFSDPGRSCESQCRTHLRVEGAMVGKHGA